VVILKGKVEDVNMKTEIVIHIGLHKTGTTFLQTEVFPKIPDINYQTKVDLTTKVEEGKINLFSDENLDGGSYRLFNTVEQRYTILENLHKLYPTAKIILCIRDKDRWLKSAYKQYIVAYKSCSFEEYKRCLDVRFTHYKVYIEDIKKYFNNVYVCTFEELQMNPKKFVKSMCDFIGVQPPEFENKTVYKGITDNQVLFIRVFDTIFPSRVLHFILSIGIRIIRKDKTIQLWMVRKE